MAKVELKYGTGSIPFEYDDDRFEVLDVHADTEPLSDFAIGELLDSPIGCDGLFEQIDADESVLFVVPDATRRAGTDHIVNLLVRRFIASGIAPGKMSVIFSTGIHRRVTEEEKRDILTPFIAQRIKTLDHDARDLMQMISVGETSGGITVELNRALFEFDHVVLIGSVAFHYFAGFTGGRKLICPGLASSKTIAATHKLAFDCETKFRREGVGTGLLNGNAVHEAFVEAASYVNISMSISTIVDQDGNVKDVFCGDLITSHRAACDAFSERFTLRITEKRDLVIVSCGGHPYDINVIQAHKSLEVASHACNEGGTIILLAECRDGLGREDLLQWFEAADSSELAVRLCERYQVNGQTAWSILRMAERFNVEVLTSLDDEVVSKMRMRRTHLKTNASAGYVIPNGSRIRLVT